MEVAGCCVTNRFELFYDEDIDPLEILKQTEEEKQRKKVEKTQKDKKAPKPAKATAATSLKKPEPIKTAVKDVEVPKSRPPRQEGRSFPPRIAGFQDSNKEAEKNTRNKDDAFFNPPDREEFRRGRGGYRGRGRGDRGGRGGGNFENRPRRMFDRHSGSDKTGVRATDKREGAGSNNWGDVQSDIDQGTAEARWDEFESKADQSQEVTNWGDEDPVEASVVDDKAGGDNLDSSDTKENDQNAEQVQDAVKEMTLDEYKREQEAQKVVHKFNIRKPGEGEDDKQWKKGYVLKKKQEEEEEADDDDEEEEDFGKKGQQKVLLDFQFNFSDSRRGMRGRGRGGRGAPRGGNRDNGSRDAPREDRREPRGGRGAGPKPNRGQQSAPRVDDFNDFPSLNTA